MPPTQATVDPLTVGKLQFAVGTANIGGTAGLNTVATLRKPDGTSAVLFSTPTIVGPAGFVVPTTADGVTDGGVDAGTNTISGTTPQQLGTKLPVTTFGSSGGVFGYGFQPDNSTTGGGASFARYALPFYAPKASKLTYLAGPPAFPQTRDGNYPTGFAGWTLGFTDFAATPVAGSYALNVVIPTGFDGAGNATSGTISASATLGSAALLPAIAPPTFTPDGAGGGTATITVPPGIVDAYVFIVDTDPAATNCFPGTPGRPVYYALETRTAGTQQLTLPPNLGPTAPGFANTRSICSGDKFSVYAAGFNYDATAAAPPRSTSQLPTIVGANGQADVTTSKAAPATYP
ncbi:MAG: hypothetical protein NVS3B16_09780 [Vulcanimicrobiaceae bacterium]